MATTPKPKPKPKAKKPAPTPRAPRRRQPALPGLEAPRIPELDRAAEAYVEIRDRRMALTTDETAAQDALLAVMRKHDLTVYRLDGDDAAMLVSVNEGKAKVSVRKVKESSEADEEAA